MRACALFRCLLMFAWPAIAIMPMPRQGFIGDGLDGDFTDSELKFLVMPDRTSATISDSGESSQVTGSTATSVNETSVIFVKQNNWGSSKVRADEAAYNMRQLGWQAKSLLCEDICDVDAAAPTNVQTWIVHVKFICTCACSMPGTHFYDPVDQFSAWDDWETHLQDVSGCDSTTFVPQTELMKTTMLENGLEPSEVLPHHHSNYQGRRHVMKDSSSFRIGLVGDFTLTHGNADWLIYLVDGCLNQTGSTGHAIKMLRDLTCNITAANKSPSPTGDCYAQKIATLDLAVVWREQETINTGTQQTKPSQRLVNVMSAGVPFVADGTFAAHSDVLHEHLESPFLASSPEQLCTSIHTLIENKHLRKSASKLGLRLARHYTPHAIAQSYANSLTAVAERPADTADNPSTSTLVDTLVDS